MKCNACEGIGFVARQRRKRWYQGGTWCYISSTPTETIMELCDDCHGSGRGLDPRFNPDCNRCHGTGTETVDDGCGGVDFDECTCKREVNFIEAELLSRLEVR